MGGLIALIVIIVALWPVLYPTLLMLGAAGIEYVIIPYWKYMAISFAIFFGIGVIAKIKKKMKNNR